MLCPVCSSNIPNEARFCPKCGTKLTQTKQDKMINSKIDDRYILLELLGEGGSGVVYLARHITLNKRVVIKILHNELMEDKASVKKFQKEATAVNELENEHIIKILDFGKLPTGQPYTVMEYLNGKTLSEHLNDKVYFSFEDTKNIIGQICDGLSEAHALGFVHRDIRPRNIMMLERQNSFFIKILDFGLSKILNSPEPSKSAIGVVLGDPTYTAPEQIKTQNVDQRTDIYSIGIITYQMLSGTLPFIGNTVFEIMGKHLDDPYPPLERKFPFLPKGIDVVLSKAMAKHKEDRFKTVLQFKKALDSLIIPQITNEPPEPVKPQQHNSFINLQYQFQSEEQNSFKTPSLIRIAGGGAVRVQNSSFEVTPKSENVQPQSENVQPQSENVQISNEQSNLKSRRKVALDLTPPPIKELSTLELSQTEQENQQNQTEKSSKEKDENSKDFNNQISNIQESSEETEKSIIDASDEEPEEDPIIGAPSETFIARESESLRKFLLEKKKERKLYVLIISLAVLIGIAIYFLFSFVLNDEDIDISDQAENISNTSNNHKTITKNHKKIIKKQIFPQNTKVEKIRKTTDATSLKKQIPNSKLSAKTINKIQKKHQQKKLNKISKTKTKQKKQEQTSSSSSPKKTPPYNIDLKLKKAKNLFYNGEFTQALIEYKSILKIAPTNYKALMGYASVHFEQGKFKTAEKYFLKAVTSANTARAWYKLGAARQRLGKNNAAKQAYHKALTINPTYSPAVNALKNLQ